MIVYCALWLPALWLLAVLTKLRRRPRAPGDWRLLWAGAPLPSLATASRALSAAGHDSASLATHRTTNTPDGLFDIQLETGAGLPGFRAIAYCTRAILAFARELRRRDAVHMFFSGGVLNQTPLRDWEPKLWKRAGATLILMPYGSDAFVYHELPDEVWAEEIKATYPRAPALDRQIEKRITRFTELADCVVGAVVHTHTLPRVDAWPVLWYPPGDLPPASEPSAANVVRIAHPSNHRRIKGTDQLVEAVERLRARGLPVELDVIEGVDLEASRARLADADIVFDQLHMGYAMTAIEGMAMGRPVLSGINAGPTYAPFHANSYLGEAPIVAVTPETLEAELERLVSDADLRKRLGRAGRDYVARRHSDAATVELFREIYAAIADDDVARLATLYSR